MFTVFVVTFSPLFRLNMVTVKVLFRIHLFLTLNMATCHKNFIYFVFFCVQVQKKGVAKPPEYLLLDLRRQRRLDVGL